MNKIQSLFFALLLSTISYAQFTNSINFHNIIYEQTGLYFGIETLHLTQNEKYIMTTADWQIQIFELDESGMPVNMTIVGDIDYSEDQNCWKQTAITRNDSLIFHYSNCDSVLYVFSFDSNTGEHEIVQEIKTASYRNLCVSIDNKYLYAKSYNEIFTYQINYTEQAITQINKSVFTELPEYDYRKIYNSPNPDILFLSNDYDSVLYVCQKNKEGLLSIKHSYKTDSSKNIYTHSIYDIEYDSKGRIYITSMSDDLIGVYTLSEKDSSLIPYQTIYGIKSPFSISFDRENKHVFFLTNSFFAEMDGWSSYVNVYNWNNDSLVFSGCQYFGDDKNAFWHATDLIHTSSGKTIYASVYGSELFYMFSLGASPYLGEDIHACPGDTVTVELQEDFESYTWWNGETVKHPFSFTSDTTVSIQVIDEFGRIGTDTVIIDFAEPLAFEGGNIKEVNFQEELTVSTIDSFSSYVWSTGDTVRTISFIPNNVQVSSDTVITATVTTEYGCSFTDSIFITIHNIPDLSDTLAISIEDQTITNLLTITGKTSEIQTVNINSLTGNLVYSKTINQQEDVPIDIDLSFLSKGIYMVFITSEDKAKSFQILKKDSSIPYTSTSINRKNKEFCIYPTIFRNEIAIEGDVERILSIKVLSIDGNLLKEIAVNAEKQQKIALHLNYLNAGTYVLQLVTADFRTNYVLVKQ